MAQSTESETPFVVNASYTRKDLYRILGIPEEDQRGRWNTGYTKHNEEIYVFCNVGIPGRTGHDYPNRWEGKELFWQGKVGSRLRQPFIQEMLSPETFVHFFWRRVENAPFIYAGCPDYWSDAKDTSPVEVRWGFADYPTGQPAKPTSRSRNRPNIGTDELSTAIRRIASGIVQRVSASGKITTIKRPMRTGPEFRKLIAALTALWEQQRGMCTLCGRAIPLSPTNRLLQMSPDRIESRAKTYLAPNVHIVHLACNLAKGEANLSEWAEFLQLLRDPVCGLRERNAAAKGDNG